MDNPVDSNQAHDVIPTPTEPGVLINLGLANEPGERRFGITYTHEDGAQDIGRAAVRNTVRALLDKEPLAPQSGEDRMGFTMIHEDGSFDTGTRAFRNAIRVARGLEPKVYKRTVKR